MAKVKKLSMRLPVLFPLSGRKAALKLGVGGFAICLALAAVWLLESQGGIWLLLHPPKVTGGILLPQQQALLSALKASWVGNHIRSVRVGSDSAAEVAAVEFTMGTVQEKQVSRTQIERTAAAILREGFQQDPKLNELDLIAVKPVAWKGKRQVTRTVFSAAAQREWVADLLTAEVPPSALVSGTGRVYWAPGLVDRAPSLAKTVKAKGEWPEPDERLKAPKAPSGAKIPVLLRGRSSRPTVALTFDDGPHAMYTPLILDILRRHHVKATFFIVGIDAREFPELVRRIAAEGHVIGNHTYSHIRLTRMSLHEAVSELQITDGIIEEITGHTSRWYRPPGGSCDVGILRALSRFGYVPVLWTQNTGDWANPPARRIVAKALRRLGDGSIILMHCDGIKTVQALPAVIELIRERGYRLGTIDDISSEHGYQLVSPSKIVKVARSRPLFPVPAWLLDHLYPPE